MEDEPIAFVDGQPIYDEDTLNRLTSGGKTDTSIEGLIADLELSDTQAEALIHALETAAIDSVDDVDFYQLEEEINSTTFHNFGCIFIVKKLQPMKRCANEDYEFRRMG